jgi:hypothetical protein
MMSETVVLIIMSTFIRSGQGWAGLTDRQFELLGVTVPVKPGWFKKVLGEELTEAEAEVFVSLRDDSARHTHACSIFDSSLSIDETVEILNIPAHDDF